MNLDQKLQVGVKSLIVNSKGEFLLIKRDQSIYPESNNPWDIPGGRIDVGVSLAENLKREISEETGLNAETLGIVEAQDILKADKHVVRITYISRVTNTKVILSKEHTEFTWLKLNELLKTQGVDKYVVAILKDKTSMSFIKDILRTNNIEVDDR